MPEESNRSAARRSESARKTPLSRVFPKNPRAHLAPSVVISPVKLHISKDLNKIHELFVRTEQTSGNTPISNKMLHSRQKNGECANTPRSDVRRASRRLARQASTPFEARRFRCRNRARRAVPGLLTNASPDARPTHLFRQTRIRSSIDVCPFTHGEGNARRRRGSFRVRCAERASRRAALRVILRHPVVLSSPFVG